VAKRLGNREPRNIDTENRTAQVPDQSDAVSQSLTGVVGDASATASRSGDDTRRRGWFWHWNHVVTQYAPLIGLKGVGLLNSYTVWTDRREESPHRGYAFPSQQSEADFYGEDRAELITINKILVALDLIEIRKEMVFRVDERGRRWKVPHNFYRVKDQGEGVSLTTRDVARVIELADRDRAAYRYLRKLFSPRFSPIDPDNVWHQILEDLRPTETWQRLAARTERDESRASARSKAGHAARRTNDSSALFSLPNDSDSTTPEATVVDSANDSPTVFNDSVDGAEQTIVATTNNGSTTSDEQSNNGLDDFDETSVEPVNTAGSTNVAPSNRTYNQEKTTTTTTPDHAIAEEESTAQHIDEDRTGPRNSTVQVSGPGEPPDARRDEDAAIRGFEEANERPSTIAERRLLRNLATQFEEAAARTSMSGWRWVADAIDEAVSAGSRFVAPKRIREILGRWEVEGRDKDAFARNEPKRDTTAQPVTTQAPGRVGAGLVPAHGERDAASGRNSGRRNQQVRATTEPPPAFTIAECGLTSRQVWHTALGELRASADFGRAGAETWLRDTHLIGRSENGGLVVGVSNALALRRLEGRYLNTIEHVLAQVIGVALPVQIADYRTWQPSEPQSDDRTRSA
jgi:hypothetical protein